MGVVDRRMIDNVNACDVEEKVEWNEESRKISCVCLSMWVDSQGMRACVLYIQISKHS